MAIVRLAAKMNDSETGKGDPCDCMDSAEGRVSPVVTLNVGGKKYTTTLQTLSARGDNMLTRLATTSLGVARDAKGHIFIDRSGRLFEYVLEYLRTGKLRLSPKDAHLRQAVHEELRFFAIRGLAGDVSDALLEDLLGAARQEKVADLLQKYKAAVEQIVTAVLEDLHGRAEAGLLSRGYGGVVFICGEMPAKFQQPSRSGSWDGRAAIRGSSPAECWQATVSDIVKAFFVQGAVQQSDALMRLSAENIVLSQLASILPPRPDRVREDDLVLSLRIVTGVESEEFHSLCSSIVAHLTSEYHLSVVVQPEKRNRDAFLFGVEL